MVATGSVKAMYYDQEFGPIKLTSRRKDGIPRKSYMGCGYPKGGNQTPKVPYRPTSGSIIEEIDDD